MNPQTSPTRSRAFDYKPVTVEAIDTVNAIARVSDKFGHYETVRMDIQRTKGALPEVGETWLIDKMFGVWTFAAIMGYDGSAVDGGGGGGGGGGGTPVTFVFAPEVQARVHVPSLNLQVDKTVAPDTIAAVAAVDSPFFPVPGPAGADGGGGFAGVVQVDADGGGDYTTLKGALTYIAGQAAGHWLIYVRGGTTETSSISFSATDVTIIGQGADATVNLNPGVNMTISADVTLVGVIIAGSGNLTFNGAVRASDGSIGSQGTLYFANAYITNCYLSGATAMVFDGDCFITGGYVSTPSLEVNNLDYNIVGVKFDQPMDFFSWIGGVLSGVIVSGGNFTIKGATNSFCNFALLVEDGNLVISKNKNTGTVAGTGSVVTVSGNNNKVVAGVGITVTNSGTGNTIL